MRLFFRRLLANIPTRLPVGVTEFNAWADDILEMYPHIPNNESAKFALAAQIVALKPTQAYMPKAYFGNVTLKSCATQVAQEIMQDLYKKKQAKEQEEKQAAKQLELISNDGSTKITENLVSKT